MIYPPNQKPPIWAIDPGIVAYNCQKHGFPYPMLAMPMWEGAGNRALDYSGHGNHGAIVGADWVTNGLKFIATNSDYVSIPQTVISGPEFSIIFSEFSSGSTNEGYFCSDSNDPANLFFRRELGDPDSYTGGIGDKSFVKTVISRESWHQSVIMHSAGGVGKWYVDTNLVKTITDTNFVSLQNDLYLGNRQDLTRDFEGSLAYIYIFNTAFNLAQIKFIYENPCFAYEIPEKLYGYVATPPVTFIPRIIMF